MKKGMRILAGLLLLVVGCMFFLYPTYREWRTQQEVEKIIDSFAQVESEPPVETDAADTADGLESGVISQSETEAETFTGDGSAAGEKDMTTEAGISTGEAEETATANADYSKLPELYRAMQEYNVNLANGQSITDAWTYEQTPVEFPDIDQDYPVIGYIEIPDMDLRLPLLVGASEENLEEGAAILSGTSMPVGGTNTNCVIAAHRGWQGSAYFQYIEDLGPGSKVYITTPWETLVYEFRAVEITTPDDINSVLIQEGKDMITLFTCHPYQLGGGPYRYLVYCDRVTGEGTGISETEMQTESPTSNPVTEGTMTDEEATESAKTQAADKKETGENLSPAVIQSETEGIDLIAIEQVLRILLPAAVITFAVFVLLSRLFPKRQRKRRKQTRKSRTGSKKDPGAVPKIGKKRRL